MSAANKPQNLREILRGGYVVLDFETSGTDPRKHDIIQIGLIRCDSQGNEVEKLLVNVPTAGKISPEAYAVHGLSKADLTKGDFIHQSEVRSKVQSFIGNLPIVAYNARFEQSFLKRYNIDLGSRTIVDPWLIHNKVLRSSEQTGPSTLENVAQSEYARKWGVQLDTQLHNALNDARATNKIVLAQAQELESNPDPYRKPNAYEPQVRAIQFGTWRTRQVANLAPPPAERPTAPLYQPSDPRQRIKGMRLSSDLPKDLIERLEKALPGQAGERLYKVEYSPGAPEGYQRLVISDAQPGGHFQGRQAMVIDVRAGGKTALGMPALAVRSSASEYGNELVLGVAAVRDPLSQTWNLNNPVEHLAAAIQASFSAAREQLKMAVGSPRLESISPTGELHSVLTKGGTRHEVARAAHRVPGGLQALPSYATQSEQLEAARRIGVVFSYDEKSPDTPYVQRLGQMGEIHQQLNQSQGVFRTLVKSGIFYALGKSEGEEEFSLKWVGESKAILDQIEDLHEQDRLQRQFGFGYTVNGQTPRERINSLIKTIKGLTVQHHSRAGGQPTQEVTYSFKGPNGQIVERTLHEYVTPLTLEEAQRKHGPRFWEKLNAERQPATYLPGVILPGEEHQTPITIGRSMIAKIPYAGAALVNSGLLDQHANYGTDLNPVIRLPQINNYRDLEYMLNVDIGQVRGLSLPAGEGIQKVLGRIRSGQPGSEEEREILLAAESREHPSQILGGTFSIPPFYDPQTGDLYAHGSVAGLELRSTQGLVKTLNQRFADTGLTFTNTSESTELGEAAYLTLHTRNRPGAGFKAIGGIKPGNIPIIGLPGKQLSFSEYDNPNVAIPLDLVTNELKANPQLWLSVFMSRPYDQKMELLNLIQRNRPGIGKTLVKHANKLFAKSKVVNIDQLTGEYRQIMGDSGANWQEIFLEIGNAIIDIVRDPQATREQAKLKSMGIWLPKAGELYAGLVSNSERLMLSQVDAEMAKNFGGSTRIRFTDIPGLINQTSEMSYRYEPVENNNVQVLMLPMALRTAFEWPGGAKYLNMESIEATAHSFTETARALGILPTQSPGDARGRMSNINRGWSGTLKAFSLNMGALEGQEVKFRGNLVMTPQLAKQLSERLGRMSKKDEAGRMELVRQFIESNFGYDESDPRSTPGTISFPNAGRFLPMPEHIEAIDISDAEGHGQAYLISMYLNAIRDLAEIESQSGTINVNVLLESHNRLMGGIHSRIGKLSSQSDLAKKLFSRPISNTLSQHFYHLPFLPTGYAFMDNEELERMARASGISNPRDIQDFIRYINQTLGGKAPGIFQRYPTVDIETASVGVQTTTEQYWQRYFKDLIPGFRMPNMGSMRGMIGMSMMSILGLIGDWDYDPNQYTSGIIVDWEEYIDNQERTRRRPVFNVEAIERDFQRQIAAGRSPFANSTFERDLEETMRSEHPKYNIVTQAMAEMHDPNVGAFRSAARSKYVESQELRQAARYYYRNIAAMRGVSYNTMRETKAMLSFLHMDPGAYLGAMRSFAVDYQHSLEYGLEAGQETSLQSMITKAKFDVSISNKSKWLLHLKSALHPPDALGETSPSYKNLMVSGGLQAGSDPSSLERAAWGNYRDFVKQVAQDKVISDDLLAALVASFGDETVFKDDVYNQNVNAIRQRLAKHREEMEGQYSEEDIIQARINWLGDKTEGDMHDREIGQYSPLTTMIATSAGAKSLRDALSGQRSGKAVLMNAFLPWRGQWLTIPEFMSQPEVQFTNQMRGLLTGHMRDSNEASIPTPLALIQMAENARNQISGATQMLNSLIKYWGFETATLGMDPNETLTQESIEQLRQPVARMRASQIGSIASGAMYHAVRHSHAVELGMSQLGFDYDLGRKALVDIGYRHFTHVLDRDIKIAGSVFEDESTARTEAGWRAEDFFKRRSILGMHIGKSEAFPAGLRFKVGDTIITGTPDFLKIEDGHLIISELKNYRFKERGQGVALAQGIIYARGLTAMAQGRADSLLPGQTAEEAQLELKNLLKEWATSYKNDLARELKANPQDSLLRSTYEQFDPQAFAAQAFELAKAGKVKITPVVVHGPEGNERIAIPNKPDDVDLDAMTTLGGYTPEQLGVSAQDLVNWVNKEVQENLGFIAGSIIALHADEMWGESARKSVLAESLRLKSLKPNRASNMNYNFMRKVGLAARFFMGEDIAKLPAAPLRAARYEGQVRAESNLDNTMIRAGETVHLQGRQYEMLGYQGDLPGDTHTIRQALNEGLLVPKELIKNIAGNIAKINANQTAARRARGLSQRGMQGHMHFGDNRNIDMGDNSGSGQTPAEEALSKDAKNSRNVEYKFQPMNAYSASAAAMAALAARTELMAMLGDEETPGLIHDIAAAMGIEGHPHQKIMGDIEQLDPAELRAKLENAPANAEGVSLVHRINRARAMWNIIAKNTSWGVKKGVEKASDIDNDFKGIYDSLFQAVQDADDSGITVNAADRDLTGRIMDLLTPAAIAFPGGTGRGGGGGGGGGGRTSRANQPVPGWEGQLELIEQLSDNLFQTAGLTNPSLADIQGLHQRDVYAIAHRLTRRYGSETVYELQKNLALAKRRRLTVGPQGQVAHELLQVLGTVHGSTEGENLRSSKVLGAMEKLGDNVAGILSDSNLDTEEKAQRLAQQPLTSGQIEGIRTLAKVAGSGEKAATGVGHTARQAGLAAALALENYPEAFKKPSVASAGRAGPYDSMNSNELIQANRALTASILSLRESVHDAAQGQQAHVEALRANVESQERGTAKWNKAIDEYTNAIANQSTAVHAETKIAGLNAAMREAMGGYSNFEELAQSDPATARKYMGLMSKRADLEKQRAKDINDLRDSFESGGGSEKIGFALRSIFGGLGMFYLQRVMGMAAGDLTRGYEPATRLRQDASATSQRLFGTQGYMPYSSELAYQKAMMREGGGLVSGMTNFMTMLSTQQAIGGHSWADIISAGKAGVGGGLASTFILSELAQAKIVPKGSVVPGAIITTLLSTLAEPILQQMGWMANPEQTTIGAAAQYASGNDWRARYMNSMPVLQRAFINAITQPWYEKEEVEGWQYYSDAELNIQRKRGPVTQFRLRVPDLMKDVDKMPTVHDTVRYGMMAQKLSETGEVPTNLSPKELFMLAATAAAQQNGIFANLDPSAVAHAIQSIGAANLSGPGYAEKLAVAIQSGVDISTLGISATQAFGFPISAQSTQRLAFYAPTSLPDVQVTQAGLGALNQLNPAYVQNALGWNTEAQWPLYTAIAAGWSNQPMFKAMLTSSQLYERGFISGAGSWMDQTPPNEIMAMTNPAERTALHAEQLRRNRQLTLRDNLINQFGATAGTNLYGTSQYMLQRYGLAGQAGAENALDVYSLMSRVTANPQLAQQTFLAAASAYATGDIGTMNQLQGVLAGDPIATQMAALQSPQIAQALASAGFGQISDVNLAGQVTGHALWSTGMSQADAVNRMGAAWASGRVGQAATGGASFTGSSTGKVYGGIRGAQTAISNLQYEAQRASIGSQMAQLQLQAEYMPKFWALEDRSRAMQYGQQQWQFGFQQRQLDMQNRQFMQNFALNLQQSQMQRGWARQDWGYQDIQRNLQWQWKQEDFGEEVRFMTGRQRKLAERGMRRETIMHDIEGEQIDRQRERQKDIWKLEDERFDVQLQQHRESLAMQEEQLQKSREFFEERWALETESIALHREYQKKQLELQMAAAGAQAHYAEEIHKSTVDLQELQMEQDDEIAKFKLAWNYGSLAGSVLNSISSWTRSMITYLEGKKIALDLAVESANNKTGANRLDEPGGASGLDMIVPAGYDRDDYLVRVRSGEHVKVTMPFADQAKPYSPWNNTILPGNLRQSESSPTAITIYIGDEKLGTYILDHVSNALRI